MQHSGTHAVPIARQQGMTLVVALIILLVLSLIGIQGLRAVSLEERMSGNQRDQARALEAAEAALSNAEAWLLTQGEPAFPASDGSSGVWTSNSPTLEVDVWWSTNGTEFNTQITGLSAQPQYAIEEHYVSTGGAAEIGSLAQTPTRYFYRITVRAQGNSADTVVNLQTIFAVNYL